MKNEYCKVTCSKRLENWPVACGARDLGRLSALRPVLESFGQFSRRLAAPPCASGVLRLSGGGKRLRSAGRRSLRSGMRVVRYKRVQLNKREQRQVTATELREGMFKKEVENTLTEHVYTLLAQPSAPVPPPCSAPPFPVPRQAPEPLQHTPAGQTAQHWPTDPSTGLRLVNRPRSLQSGQNITHWSRFSDTRWRYHCENLISCH